jgi:hypothetical protein
MRQRLTWARRASAHPAYPDEGAASPAYQPDPEADAYENGDPSSWAEDPHAGPYLQSAHPAYPDEGPASPAYIAKQGSVAMALERKAAKCVRLASAMLGPQASQSDIENQALSFMDMNDRALQASLARLAAQEGEEQDGEEQEAEEQQEKASKKKAHAKAAYLRRLAQQIEDEAQQEESDEDSDEAEEQQDKKGKKASLESRLARIESLLMARQAMQYQQAPVEAQQSDEEMLLEALMAEEQQAEEEAMLEAMQGEAQQSPEEAMLEAMLSQAQQAPKQVAPKAEHMFGPMAQQLAMQGEETGALSHEALRVRAQAQQESQQVQSEAQQLEAQLAEMLQEEEMGQVLGAEYQDAAEESMMVDPMGDFDGAVSDPMGLMDSDDDAILASLFGEMGKQAKKGQQHAEEQEGEEQEAEEQQEKSAKKGQQKTAALRPQPRKTPTGATRLGGNITKEAAEVNDLSNLWESAPDVSKYF